MTEEKEVKPMVDRAELNRAVIDAIASDECGTMAGAMASIVKADAYAVVAITHGEGPTIYSWHMKHGLPRETHYAGIQALADETKQITAHLYATVNGFVAMVALLSDIVGKKSGDQAKAVEFAQAIMEAPSDQEVANIITSTFEEIDVPIRVEVMEGGLAIDQIPGHYLM